MKTRHTYKVIGVVLIMLFVFGSSASASNIGSSATTSMAWNDVVGWIDFYVNNNGVIVQSSELKRWAEVDDVSGGYMALNCDSIPPGGSIDCSPSFSVTNSSTTGDLAGWGWSDDYGWISFASTTPYTYGVDIGCLTGDFTGFAWNDVIGWISFNCANDHDAATGGTQAYCAANGGYDYKVNTTWRCGDPENETTDHYLESVTFDTGSTDGFAINSIYWEGTLPADATIGFQIAVSTSTTFSSADFLGPDGTISTIYQPGTGDTGGGGAIIINGANHHAFESGYRYFRYRVYLDKLTTSPVVSEVNINWTR